MLSESFRYPLGRGAPRDALAVCTGLFLATFLLLRVGRALWPDLIAVVAGGLALVPAGVLAGYLGQLLRVDPAGGAPPVTFDGETLRAGGRFLAVAGVYLLPAAVALVGTASVLLAGASGPLVTLGPTVALLATVVGVYLLPAALATAVGRGVRAALTREAVSGLASGSYFFAWTVATTLVVVAWSALAAVGARTLAGVLAAAALAYAHVVSARLLNEGLSRSRWSP